METMYPGFTNSPETTLTGDITNVATTIPVAELGVFPAAPNIATIGTGEDAETILYAAKSAATGAGDLTGCTREYDKTGTYGQKLAWASGSVISRNFANIDLYAIQTNIDTLVAGAYVHPNHTGDVTSVADGATTIVAASVTLAKMADMATASLLGRNTAGVGVPEVLSKVTSLALLNVEDGADVTDATNVNAAGAVMETDYNAYTVLAADTDNTPAPLTVGASTVVGRKASGGIVAVTMGELGTLLGAAEGSIPTYGAIVYQSATNTIAVDMEGNVLDSNAITDYADDIVINAAITYVYNSNSGNARATSKGRVFICAPGIYQLAAPLIMKYGVSVECADFFDTEFIVKADIDCVRMTRNSHWYGGFFLLHSDIGAAYTGSVFLLDADAVGTAGFVWQYGMPCQITDVNVLMYDEVAGGKVLWLKCETTSDDNKEIGIYSCYFRNFQASGAFDYGIYVTTSDNPNQYHETVAWNHFENFYLTNCKYAIREYEVGPYGSSGRGTFKGIYIEPGTATDGGVKLDGRVNIISELCIDDWTLADHGYALELTANSLRNTIITSQIWEPGFILDSGSNNTINSYTYVPAYQIRDTISDILDVLGANAKLLVPMNNGSGTTLTDYTLNANHLTSSFELSTGGDYDLQSYRYKGGYLCLNGTSHYASKTDAGHSFSFNTDGLTDLPFSVIAMISPTVVASRNIMGKWSETTGGEKREWKIGFTSGGYPLFTLYDESANAYLSRYYNSTGAVSTATDTWTVFIATYDGTAAVAGMKIYANGTQVDNTTDTDGTYVAMEDLGQPLYVGCTLGASAVEKFFKGQVALTTDLFSRNGLGLVAITGKELSASEVWSLTQRIKGLYGIN